MYFSYSKHIPADVSSDIESTILGIDDNHDRIKYGNQALIDYYQEAIRDGTFANFIAIEKEDFQYYDRW